MKKFVELPGSDENKLLRHTAKNTIGVGETLLQNST